MHRRTTLFLIIALLALPAAAHASTRQESLFQDDAALIYSGDQRREQALDELQALGVDVIRSNLVWRQVAADPSSRKRPGGDPYATAGWARWDALVRGAQRRGMAVQLTVTGPLPLWASNCHARWRIQRICRPKFKEFGRFVAAAARRYPTVHRWSIWNEPNQAGWLYPQYRSKHHPEAPWRYRYLAYRAIDALRANGHAHDRIMLGETAPIGRRSGSWPKRSMSPAPFLRDVLCINSRGHAMRSSRLHCWKHFRRLRVNAYAHHPYTRGAGHSPRTRARSGDITLRYMSRLGSILNHARRRHRIGWLPIYITEYGFQTNPPDRWAGARTHTAARWMNESAWMAYRIGRVRSVAQYELFDEHDLGAFQTGLRFEDGRDKPGLRAYRLPIWVVRTHHRTSVWGWARGGGHSDRIAVRFKPRHGKWRYLRTARPNSHGFIRVHTRRSAHRWQLYWRDSAGHMHAKSRWAGQASR